MEKYPTRTYAASTSSCSRLGPNVGRFVTDSAAAVESIRLAPTPPLTWHPPENWARLGGWLVLGLAIYFFYGRRHSILGQELRKEISMHGVSPAGMPAGGSRVEI